MRELRRYANLLYEALDTAHPSDTARYEYELVSGILEFRTGLARAPQVPGPGWTVDGGSDEDRTHGREPAGAMPS